MAFFTKFLAIVYCLSIMFSSFFSPNKTITYYIDSVSGNDNNIGTSESKPMKTLAALEERYLKDGAVVKLKCGSVFRETLDCKTGVTYMSYSDGEKPTIMPSVSGADKNKWIKTDYLNVWKFTCTFSNDVGNIIFNNGEKTGIKIAKKIKGYSGTVTELKNDLEFLSGNDGCVYLYSEANPAERFSDIELAYRTYGIYLNTDVTVDGLRVLYAGSHGMDAANSDNITVRNCDVGFCGGALQSEGVRFGNGIQFWSGGNHILVENCNVYEIYDAGLTFQSKNGSFNDVIFRNNTVSRCTYAIEYFTNDDGCLSNILIDSNILKESGFGWGKQRPDLVHTSLINSWYSHDNRAENFVISNNVLQSSTHALFNIGSEAGTMPVFSGNTYRQPHSGRMFSDKTKFMSVASLELMRQMDPTGTMKYCTIEQ